MFALILGVPDLVADEIRMTWYPHFERTSANSVVYLYKTSIMDLHIRKLKIIEYLIGLQDEKIFRRIESQIEETRNNDKSKDIISKTELIERAKRSNKDYREGNVITQDQLENESKKW